MSASEEVVSFRQRLEELATECRSEQERVQSQLSEMEMLLRQTSSEIDKLSQRVSSIAGRRREMEVNLEDYSRTDIKNVYTSFLETEMRKLTMDNQRERLVSKLQDLKTYNQKLDKIVRVIEQAPDKMGDLPVAAVEEAIKPTSHQPSYVLDREEAIKLIQVQEDEMLRVGRRIQDELVQPIANVLLKAEICERLLSVDTGKARGELAELRSLVGGSLQDLRDFVLDVRPLVLEDLGLEPTLRRLVDAYAKRHGLQVELAPGPTGMRLPAVLEVIVFRLVQEALSLSRQARATAVRIRSQLVGEQEVLLEVEHNGSAGDGEEVGVPGTFENADLASMRQRIERLGGKVQMEIRPEQGTHLAIRFPVWLD